MRLDKIYTKTGDRGKTSLVTGERVAKSALRIEGFGTADELNSVIGLMRSWAGASNHEAIRSEAEFSLKQVQNDLFDIGAILACAAGRAKEVMPEFAVERIAFLEERIDRYQESLEELNSFVLPGGSMLNAYAHLARTVCRRGERVLWRLNEQESVEEPILTYINRLSDYLFVFSRWVLRVEGLPEFLWHPGGKPPVG
ncbi:MAG: cob(I)yrinic acid a,c-diamide adenosyltransferase [Lentisphaerae bacterium]|nr:cob(I)yrinic acid a,c-diamide adenosyltransferase [Lentisphaerota bacterium]